MIFLSREFFGSAPGVLIEYGGPRVPRSARRSSERLLLTWGISIGIGEELRLTVGETPNLATHVKMYGDDILEAYSSRILPS